MTRKPIYHSDEQGEPFAGDELYEECEICHQEFRGVCPINSADCPYAELDEEEDDATPAFDDVEDLDGLIEDDEEIEKIIEDGADIPLEDLVDEEAVAAPEEEEGPSKTIEEIEAERLEALRIKKLATKKAPDAKKPGKKAPAKKKKK